MNKLILSWVINFLLVCNPVLAGIDCKGDSGNEDMVIVSSDLGITSYPFSICLRIDPPTGVQVIYVSLHDASASNVYYYLERDITNESVTIVARNTTFQSDNATTDIGTSGIHSVCGVWVSATDRRVYIDGGSDEITCGCTSVAFNTATDQFSICGSDDSTPTSNAQKIYHVTVWDAQITQADSKQWHDANLRRIAHNIKPGNVVLDMPLDDYTEGTTSMGGNSFRDESGNGNSGSLTDTDGDSQLVLGSEINYP